MTDIPEGWQQLHWKVQVKLAEDILDEMIATRGADVPESLVEKRNNLDASTARAIIDGEARRRLAEKPTAMPSVPEGERTLLVWLDYDVWLKNGERVRADKKSPVTLPFDLAKKLLDEHKARRADPLPGDA